MGVGRYVHHLGPGRPAGPRLAAALVSLALGLAACSPSGRAPDAARAPSAKDADTRLAVPDGWTRGSAGRLGFAVPPGLTPSADLIPQTTVTYRGVAPADGSPPPAVGVFVESGNLGPLAVRTAVVTKVRTGQLGSPPVGPSRAITVAGATGASATEWRWDYRVGPDAPTVASRQIEVVLETSGPDQYGLLFGGPEAVLSDKVVDGFLAALQVRPAS
jgi:hypothetical protein